MPIGTVGLPRSDAVIFYHPLDSDLVEHTTTEVWQGSAAFVPGQVGPALSAITTKDVVQGTLSIYASGTVNLQNEPSMMLAVDASTILGLWSDSISESGYSRIGKLSNGIVTWSSTSGIFRDRVKSVTGDRGLHATLFDTNKVMVAYETIGPVGGYIRIGTVSGTTITWGNEQIFETAWTNGEIRIDTMDSTHTCIYYRNGATGDGNVRILQIVGTGIIAGPTAIPDPTNIFTTPQGLAITALTSTECVIVNSQSNLVYAGTRIGNSLTFGVGTAITVQGLWLDLKKYSSTQFILGLNRVNAGIMHLGSIGGVGGLEVTLDAGAIFNPMQTNALSMTTLSSNTIGFAYIDQNDDLHTNVGSLVGGVLTIGTEALVSPNARSPWISRLSDSEFMAAGSWRNAGGGQDGSSFVSAAAVDISASISGTSINYPSVSGATRISLGLWSNDLTDASANIVISRGYDITLTNSSIAIGNGTAIWNDAAILSLMTTVNDGANHFLMLDFENTAGPNWTLQTSLDGLPFVSQGLQNAGSTVVVTVDTNPSISISGGFGAGAWIDELTMWAGDKNIFTQFTSQELSDIFDVANKGGLTFDDFDSYLASLTVIPGFSINLVPDTWATNIDAPSKTVIMTEIITLLPQTSGISVSGTVDLFDKTIPFDCEVVGVSAIMTDITNADFDGTGGSVTITVESSDQPDISPRVPFNEISLPTPVWKTLVSSVQCKAITTDGLCLDATNDINVMDQTNITLRQFASLRAVVIAQVEDAYPTGSGVTPVSMIVTTELRPVNLKERRFL